MTALAITRAGQGFPLVLVHGFLAGARIWQEQIEFFKDRFDVVAFNLPGFGDSRQIKAPETIVGFAEIILNQLSSIGVGKFHLMGHSMGGMIVQAMADLAPERVSKLVCYGTGPVVVMPNRFETIEQSRQRFQNDGIEVTAKQIAATWFIEGESAEKYPLCVELGMQASMQACLASLSAWGRSCTGARWLSDRSPPVRPPAPGSCTEWVASKTTGRPVAARCSNPPMSTTSRP